MKQKERALARNMRKRGCSIVAICRELGVSKSSVSVWVRDVELTKEQQDKLRQNKGKGIDGRMRGARANREIGLRRRQGYQQIGREKAKGLIDVDYIAGCMLYWGEGTKSVREVTFVNSDASMMRVFVQFLRKYFDVPNQKISLSVTCYLNNGMDLSDITQYWLDLLGLDEDSLRKCRVKSGGKSKGKLPYGICTLRVYDVKIVQQIYGSIQEYAGFENRHWLG